MYKELSRVSQWVRLKLDLCYKNRIFSNSQTILLDKSARFDLPTRNDPGRLTIETDAVHPYVHSAHIQAS